MLFSGRSVAIPENRGKRISTAHLLHTPPGVTTENLYTQVNITNNPDDESVVRFCRIYGSLTLPDELQGAIQSRIITKSFTDQNQKHLCTSIVIY